MCASHFSMPSLLSSTMGLVSCSLPVAMHQDMRCQGRAGSMAHSLHPRPLHRLKHIMLCLIMIFTPTFHCFYSAWRCVCNCSKLAACCTHLTIKCTAVEAT
jgi:hypothetical protein